MKTKSMIAALVAAPLALSSAAAVPAATQTNADTTSDPFIAELTDLFAEIEKEYRPDVRWWLAEGLNTDATLRRNIRQIDESGFGAAEFLAMPEEGAPDETYGWGSDEWTADSRLVMEDAVERGLGFSLTSGTHWATANLPNTYTWDGAPFDYDNKAASKELGYATIDLAPGETFDGTLPRPPRDAESRWPAALQEYVFQGVVAARVVRPRTNAGVDYGEGSGTGELDFDSLVDLSDRVVETGAGDTLSWTAPSDGRYALFAYWMHGTGETASPSVSTNYTINYIDRYGIEAFKDYWEEVVLTPGLTELIRASGRGEIYMDSLELTTSAAAGMLWGYDFKREFQERRGYDITRYLPIVSWDRTRVQSRGPKAYDYTAPDEARLADVEKIRNDINQTFSELYEENVLAPLQQWLHSLNMTLRAEPSYGTVFEISTPARYIDGIETESFAQNADFDLYRGLLGSANMYGRVFSSETGAARGRNYVNNMDYYTQLAYTQFAGGVTRTVFHGYSAIEGSVEDTHWPGHEGMYPRYSDRFNSRQPASIHYPAWTEMLGRNQKILRQGQPQRDLAILRTDNAFINYGFPPGRDKPEWSYAMHDEAYFWRDLSLQHAGYTYDYFSPQLLEDEDNVDWTDSQLQPQGPGYKALVLYQDSLELSSARRILEIAGEGLPVLFVNNTSEIRDHGGTVREYTEAASRSRSLRESDAEVQAVVARIKALGNVRTIDGPAEALSTLQSMGVRPRVSYGEPTDEIVTISRLDPERGIRYTFAYSFKWDVNAGEGPETFSLELEGGGKPYTIDDWSGAVRPVGAYEVEGDITRVRITLVPGEAIIIAQDLSNPGSELHALSTSADEVVLESGRVSVLATATGQYRTELSDGRTVTTDVVVPAPVSLDEWDISLEDWNAGEQKINTEEKFGHTTREAYYATRKTTLHFPSRPLVPWKDLPAGPGQLALLGGSAPSMAHVSGVGTYTTTFRRPEPWSAQNGAYFRVESTGGGTAEVHVNGERAPGLDLRTKTVDISHLLEEGVNTIRVVVTSTLTNRLLQRGYSTSTDARWDADYVQVQDYGLAGDARVIPYTVAGLTED